MPNKKGAMFGLDARIALVIFGALSVISGAALYSAIQQSKVVSIVVSIQEINKAIEEYFLATGINLPYAGTSAYNVNVKELVESSITGWKGPYLSYTEDSGSFWSRFQYTSLGGVEFYVDILDETIGGANGPGSATCIVGDTGCSYWTRYNGISKAIAESVDLYIDGSVDGSAGIARTHEHSADNYSVWIKGPSTL